MILSQGHLFYPFFTRLKDDEIQVCLFGFIPIKKIKLITLNHPIRTNYKLESFSTYLKYFSLLVCWKRKLKKPLYKIETLDKQSFILVRLTDRKLLILRTYLSRVKIKSKSNLVNTNSPA